MRFLSSSALASAPKLRFAASCSAAETIFSFLPSPARDDLGTSGLSRSDYPDHALAPSFSHESRKSGSCAHYIWCSAPGSPSQSSAERTRSLAMTQLLRRLAFFLRRREDLHGASGLLDGRHRRFRGAMHLNIDLGLDLAAAEQPHAVLGAAQHARLHQRLRIDGGGGIKHLGVDGLLDPVEIDLDEFEPEDVVETALGQAAVHRHLAAFKALDAHAGTRGLSLAAAARGLALAGADATADPHALLARAGIVGDIAELHR